MGHILIDRSPRGLEHDPKKWMPVLGKDLALASRPANSRRGGDSCVRLSTDPSRALRACKASWALDVAGAAAKAWPLAVGREPA
jgi:hypothetical protein